MTNDKKCIRCGTLMYGDGDENGRCNTCSKLVAAMMAYDAAQGHSSRTADAFLQNAIDLLRERGKQYDQPSGERSMGKTVTAFNAITGRDLSAAEGWLFMLLLKQVRQWQTSTYHKDSAEDSVSYSALLAEALEKKKKKGGGVTSMTRTGETNYTATNPWGDVGEFCSMAEAMQWEAGLDSDGEPINPHMHVERGKGE